MSTKKGEAGFSLIELLVVVAIILIIAVMAAPNIMTTMAQVRLRGGLRDVVGLMQQARQMAVRDNTFYQLGEDAVSDIRIIYIDVDGDGTRGTTEPSVALPLNVTPQQAGAPPFNNANAGANFTAPLVQVWPAFNARGLPCLPNGNACPSRVGGGAVPVGGTSGANVHYLLYFTQPRTMGATGWGAITVTSAGRMRTWTLEPGTNQYQN